MDNETFRSRVLNLISRSRKALRLYSNAGRSLGGVSRPAMHWPQFKAEASKVYTEYQTTQWRDITADLLQDLNAAIQSKPSVKDLSAAVYTMRDKFNSIWRALEAEIHQKQKELIQASQNSDFVKAAIVSNELVSSKAKFQAAQAAHHELDELIKRTKYSHNPIVLTDSQMLEMNFDEQTPADDESRTAKVIPIRKIL